MSGREGSKTTMKSMMKTLMSGAAIGIALAAVAPAAYAQTAAPARDEAGTSVEEVVVTAQRREELAQDVGIALSVISGEDLAERGVVTVNQLQYSTPSLEVIPAFGGGQPQFRLRGVGFDDYASNNTSPVTVYVDEVAYPYPVMTQGLLFDIDRVEVLRGPQGTLYGRNTTGGAINFITRRPTETFSAGVIGEYGSYNQLRAEGYVAGPLAPTVRGRLSAMTDQGGAWQKNRTTGEEFGDTDKLALRGQLAWDPSDRLSFLLNGHWSQDKSDGQGLYLFRDLAFNAAGFVPADQDHSNTGWGGSAVFSSVVGFPADTSPFKDNEQDGASLRADLDLDFATLTSITAYESLHRREYQDWDASQLAYAGVFFDTNARVFSQELRLVSNGEGPLSWVGGLYYTREKLTDQFVSDFWQSLGFVTNTTYEQNVEAFAGFGQIDYSFSDKLDLIVGARVENERRDLGDFVTAGVFAPGVIFDFIPPTDNSAEHTHWSGKVELEYKPMDDVLIYGSISRGVKSGGFTAYNTPDIQLLHEILPEILTAYEIGFKSTFADRKVVFNAAAYYYDYKDQQVQSAIYTAFGPIGNIVNADSHIYGAEAELTWRPIAPLVITQTVGWKKGTFDDFVDLDIDASIAAGQAVFRQRAGEDQGYPRWSYSGSISYHWDIGASHGLDADVNYAFRDTLNPVLLGPNFVVDSYWIANANLTFSPNNGPWSIGVWGRNIFDTEYDLTRNFFLPGINIAAPGRPATFGVRIGVTY
jgi:iron complex outermembrane recepter protein